MLGLPPSIYKGQSNVNTASLDLESSLVQSASISDAAQTGLEISGDQMTLESWANFESSGSSHVFMSRWSATTGFFCYNTLYTFSRIRFRIANNVGAQDYVEWTYTPTATQWHHYAFVWDGTLTVGTGSMKFYLDGVQYNTGFNIITQNDITNVRDLNVPFVIGSMGDGASPFDGLVDECRVWNVARTQPQIAANMSIQIPGATAGLQGYWRFNNTSDDETPNANNLTLNNGPVYSASVPFV